MLSVRFTLDTDDPITLRKAKDILGQEVSPIGPLLKEQHQLQQDMSYWHRRHVIPEGTKLEVEISAKEVIPVIKRCKSEERRRMLVSYLAASCIVTAFHQNFEAVGIPAIIYGLDSEIKSAMCTSDYRKQIRQLDSLV